MSWMAADSSLRGSETHGVCLRPECCLWLSPESSLSQTSLSKIAVYFGLFDTNLSQIIIQFFINFQNLQTFDLLKEIN
jgi:hypothetical protein